jgi:hypothetical protein
MLILTDSAVFLADDTTETVEPEALLEDEEICCACMGESTSAVAFEDGSVALIANGRVERLETGMEDHIECLDIVRENPIELLIGTASAHVFRFKLGATAERIEAFDQLECRSEWYTPWGGPPAVRSIAHAGDCVYADIHVGSIMRSLDRGNSWEPVAAGLHEDVHQVTTCAAAPARVYANTADAVFISNDRGQTWDHCAGGLPARYGRAIAVHPSDPDCVLASVSDGSHANVSGQLYRSGDSGRGWTLVTDGFPSETKDNIDTFHLGFSVDGRAFATVEKRLYASADNGRTWTVEWEAPRPLAAIAC